MGSRELRKDLNNLESGITEMMSKFEKKPYTEGWPEDKWKEVGIFYICSGEFIY